MTIYNNKMQEKLEKEFPVIFKDNPVYLECKSGWHELIYELVKNIDPVKDDEFVITDIKEKFGGLRVYYFGGTEQIYELVAEAESKSFEVCEVCGEAGKLHNTGGWFYTSCEKDKKDKNSLGFTTKVL